MAPRFELEPHHRNVLDEELIADLQRVSKELAKPTVTIDQYNERGRFHSSSLARRFGSWFKALERAGLAKSRTLHIANDDLFQNLAQVWTRFGRQPKYNDLTSQSSRFSNGTYENRFGGWRKALEAFVAWANEGEVHAAKPSLNERHSASNASQYQLSPSLSRYAPRQLQVPHYGAFTCYRPNRNS